MQSSQAIAIRLRRLNEQRDSSEEILTDTLSLISEGVRAIHRKLSANPKEVLTFTDLSVIRAARRFAEETRKRCDREMGVLEDAYIDAQAQEASARASKPKPFVKKAKQNAHKNADAKTDPIKQAIQNSAASAVGLGA